MIMSKTILDRGQLFRFGRGLDSAQLSAALGKDALAVSEAPPGQRKDLARLPCWR